MKQENSGVSHCKGDTSSVDFVATFSSRRRLKLPFVPLSGCSLIAFFKFHAVKIEFAVTKAFALRRRWLAAKFTVTNTCHKTRQDG